MKQKYLKYNSKLFIMLFGLNTLSSCINTSSALRMGGENSKTFKQVVKESGKDIVKEVGKAAIYSAVGGAIGYYAGSSEPSSNYSSHNQSARGSFPDMGDPFRKKI
ncbi:MULTISPECIES: hypothetical protein [Candidatus Cardinium]|uniref:hypothetical protein n=1 Tax=Candidatus Cardinium TaxID=273135 RepID=UPI001FA99DB3|nr:MULTISPECIES: hypothetical protein [Cardinium]